MSLSNNCVRLAFVAFNKDLFVAFSRLAKEYRRNNFDHYYKLVMNGTNLPFFDWWQGNKSIKDDPKDIESFLEDFYNSHPEYHKLLEEHITDINQEVTSLWVEDYIVSNPQSLMDATIGLMTRLFYVAGANRA